MQVILISEPHNRPPALPQTFRDAHFFRSLMWIAAPRERGRKHGRGRTSRGETAAATRRRGRVASEDGCETTEVYFYSRG